MLQVRMLDSKRYHTPHRGNDITADMGKTGRAHLSQAEPKIELLISQLVLKDCNLVFKLSSTGSATDPAIR